MVRFGSGSAGERRQNEYRAGNLGAERRNKAPPEHNWFCTCQPWAHAETKFVCVYHGIVEMLGLEGALKRIQKVLTPNT